MLQKLQNAFLSLSLPVYHHLGLYILSEVVEMEIQISIKILDSDRIGRLTVPCIGCLENQVQVEASRKPKHSCHCT